MNDAALRENLLELLRGGSAHTGVLDAIEGLPASLRHARPAPGIHSVWEELEHIRLAQEDILRYTLDPAWESPPWPEGYWPKDPGKLSPGKWKASVSGFRADFEEMLGLVRDPGRDPTALIPHGEGRTYLREILLVADHNAYHAGQIVLVRKLLGAWG